MAAYHPDCPHCITFSDVFKKIATDVRFKNLPLEVVGVNMSRTSDIAAGIDEYPTIRLYKTDGTYKTYNGKRNY